MPSYDNESVVNIGYLKYVTDYYDDKIDNKLESVAVQGNAMKFFNTSDTTQTPAFSLDLPIEMYLDTTQTQIETEFEFDSDTYAGAVDPNLDGKPVLVFAVKSKSNDGLTVSTNYSFLDASALAGDLKNYIRTIEQDSNGITFKNGYGTTVCTIPKM